MTEKPLTPIGIILISLLLLLLSYAGYLSYKSIDWSVLERLESQKLILPTPALPTATTSLSPSPSVKPVTK